MRDQVVEMSSTIPFSPARRLALYNQLRAELVKRGLVRVSSYVDRAREHDRHTLTLEARWEAQTERHKYSPELAELDPIADRKIRGFIKAVNGQVDSLEAGDPLIPRVKECLREVFPSGLGGVTKASYLEQAAAMERGVAALETKYAPLMAELGLTAMVQRLAEITVKYRAAVDGGHGRMEFAELDAHRERGHLYMLEIASMIVGEYHDADDPAHAQPRNELLALFREHAEQDRLERQEQRARRRRAEAGGADSDAPADADVPADTDAPSTDAGDAPNA